MAGQGRNRRPAGTDRPAPSSPSYSQVAARGTYGNTLDPRLRPAGQSSSPGSTSSKRNSGAGSPRLYGLPTPPQSLPPSSSTTGETKHHQRSDSVMNAYRPHPQPSSPLQEPKFLSSKRQPERVMSFGLVTPPRSGASSSSSGSRTKAPLQSQGRSPPPTPTPVGRTLHARR